MFWYLLQSREQKFTSGAIRHTQKNRGSRGVIMLTLNATRYLRFFAWPLDWVQSTALGADDWRYPTVVDLIAHSELAAVDPEGCRIA